MPFINGYGRVPFEKFDLLPKVMTQDRPALCRRKRRRSAPSIFPYQVLTSSLDDQLGCVVDKNEGKPGVQRVIHRKLRCGTIKLLDHERRETHRHELTKKLPPGCCFWSDERAVPKLGMLANSVNYDAQTQGALNGRPPDERMDNYRGGM